MDDEHDQRAEEPLTGRRREPIGAPVIRADPAVAGADAEQAANYDPTDPTHLSAAVEEVRRFAAGDEAIDSLRMLRGAAACAACVRGYGSYKDAIAAIGEEVGVSFVRKWARVHDLPIEIRRQVALGAIAPSAAKHIARVTGVDRYDLAWATIDHGLTVREVRAIAGAAADSSVRAELEARAVPLGHLELELPVDTYRRLRTVAANRGQTVEEWIGAAIDG
jgi:hypothetical protein